MSFKSRLISMCALAILFATFIVIASNEPKANREMLRILAAIDALKGKPIETLTPEEARKQPTPADAVKQMMREKNMPLPMNEVSVTHIQIAGRYGEIPLHIYTPAGKGPFPVVVYYHGGGFVIGSTQAYEASIKAISQQAGAIVVGVDYHLAPEYPFPAAPNDAYDAYLWVVNHAATLHGKPKHIAVAGESAGGSLATVVAMMARDRRQPLPVHQLLIYPVVNDDMENESYKTNMHAKPLNKPMMQWFFKQYMQPQATTNPYALPMKAVSLKGLPSATVITAEVDPLMTEGDAYATRLQREGVKVAHHYYAGVTHEFFGMGAVLTEAKDAVEFAAEQLRLAFDRRE